MDANKIAARVAFRVLADGNRNADSKVLKRQTGMNQIIKKLIDATGGNLNKMLTVIVMAAQESGEIEQGEVQKFVSKLQQAAKAVV